MVWLLLEGLDIYTQLQGMEGSGGFRLQQTTMGEWSNAVSEERF